MKRKHGTRRKVKHRRKGGERRREETPGQKPLLRRWMGEATKMEVKRRMRRNEYTLAQTAKGVSSKEIKNKIRLGAHI